MSEQDLIFLSDSSDNSLIQILDSDISPCNGMTLESLPEALDGMYSLSKNFSVNAKIKSAKSAHQRKRKSRYIPLSQQLEDLKIEHAQEVRRLKGIISTQNGEIINHVFSIRELTNKLAASDSQLRALNDTQVKGLWQVTSTTQRSSNKPTTVTLRRVVSLETPTLTSYPGTGLSAYRHPLPPTVSPYTGTHLELAKSASCQPTFSANNTRSATITSCQPTLTADNQQSSTTADNLLGPMQIQLIPLANIRVKAEFSSTEASLTVLP